MSTSFQVGTPGVHLYNSNCNCKGITSVYEWEGKIENDSEVLMMIKTRSSRIEELTEFVKSKFLEFKIPNI